MPETTVVSVRGRKPAELLGQPGFAAPPSVEYRPVPGFPGYQVGADGTVLSSLWGRRLTLKPSYAGQYRYLKVVLRKVGRSFNRYIHHLVLEAFVGPRPGGMEACHGNGDNTDNRLVNLRWGTSADNKADAIRHGTFTRGERNGEAKITSADVRRIRARVSAGESPAKVGPDFNISRRQVNRIVSRECWGSVE